jgi:enoyl-CoA hydratase/carnithine racemase
MTSSISAHRAGQIIHVTLDDGGKNILTLETVQELHQLITEAAEDPECRGLILMGNSRALSVGLDTKTVLSGSDDGKTLLRLMGETLKTLYLSKLRSVVMVEGHATAAGAMFLLVADYRVASGANGKIGLSEVSVGLEVPDATKQLVRDRIATQYQYAITAHSKLVDHHEARDIGFLDEVFVDGSDAMVAAVSHVESLAGLDDSAYLATKLGMRSRFREITVR